MSDLWHIPSNNTTIRRESDGTAIVTLHHTDIVRVAPSGAVTLDSGGYQTPTTKTRMNQVANVWKLGYQVYQVDYAWYVHTANGERPFHDGMTV